MLCPRVYCRAARLKISFRVSHVRWLFAATLIVINRHQVTLIALCAVVSVPSVKHLTKPSVKLTRDTAT
jgi:hypothetical protein